eukprot:scaffold73317_cov56-Phaeocystis_antarctica.AAC.3
MVRAQVEHQRDLRAIGTDVLHHRSIGAAAWRVDSLARPRVERTIAPHDVAVTRHVVAPAVVGLQHEVGGLPASMSSSGRTPAARHADRHAPRSRPASGAADPRRSRRCNSGWAPAAARRCLGLTY